MSVTAAGQQYDWSISKMLWWKMLTNNTLWGLGPRHQRQELPVASGIPAADHSFAGRWVSNAEIRQMYSVHNNICSAALWA
jgi:hypothetical protein